MWKEYPDGDIHPEAARDALILGGVFWGFVLAAYGLFQLVAYVLSFVIDNKLTYYVLGALLVACVGGAGYMLFRRSVRMFGICEVVIGMSIGGHLVNLFFSNSAFTPLAVLNLSAQTASAVFLFVRGCRDIANR